MAVSGGTRFRGVAIDSARAGSCMGTFAESGALSSTACGAPNPMAMPVCHDALQTAWHPLRGRTSSAVTHREVGASSSLQVRAREARYRLFRELAGRHGAERVALGHNADDQAETVLLRMLRGAGLARTVRHAAYSRASLHSSIAGISRQEILSYLGAAGLSYRTDSSNAKSIYLRNRVRHELLPVINPWLPLQSGCWLARPTSS